MKKLFLATILVLCTITLPNIVKACSLCGSLLTRQTLRNEMKQAQLVVYGSLANDKLNTGSGAFPGSGSTELHVLKVVKSHPALGHKSMIVIDRYIPILDKKNPPKFLVFARVAEGKLDPYDGRLVESEDMLTYLDGIARLEKASSLERLSFFCQYLDHSDSAIAGDAFLEFAKTDDRDIGEIAPKLNADQFRKLLLDPRTPSERLGLFAFLLGASKHPKDAELLRGLIEKPTPRAQTALDGVLCGVIQLQPDTGWKSVYAILTDQKRNFNDRYAAFRVLRFYYNWKPKEYDSQIMHGMHLMLADGKLADFAIDSLRRWEIWDLTPTVLGLFHKQSHSAPIVRRSIVRYAVCCPLPQAKGFVESLRKTEPDLVSEVEESLQFEKKLQESGF